MFTLEEGASYTVRLTIKNTSTRGGAPVAASLGVGISANTVGGAVLIASRVDSKSFAASEVKSLDYALSIPFGLGGQSGEIQAWAEAPDGTDLAAAKAALNITVQPIVYGATIVFS